MARGPSDKPLMRIAEAAQAAGVTKGTLEYYIVLGMVKPIRLPGRGGRRFNDEHVKRIRTIRRANEEGYTLRQIRQIFLRRK